MGQVDVISWKCFHCHHDLDNHDGITMSQMTTDMFRLSYWPYSLRITGIVARMIRRVPLVEQNMTTLPEHMISSMGFCGPRVHVTQCLVFCVVFCISFFVLFPLNVVLSVLLPLSVVLSVLRLTTSDSPFERCIVCPPINGFWLPLWYVL